MRLSVTFEVKDYELMSLICKRKKINMTSLVRTVMEDWLEDVKLGERAEIVENKLEANGWKTISHDDIWEI